MVRVFDLTKTEADICWLKAGRLRKAAAAGDEEAAEELKRMEETKMVPWKPEEVTALCTATEPEHSSDRDKGMADSHRKQRSKSWAWQEREIDLAQEHFEVSYGLAKSDPSQWVMVARVGPPTNGGFGVQFMVERANPAYEQAINAVVEEVEFYLGNKGEPDPWAYAKYHCGTASNLYSSVHWSYREGSKIKKE